MIDSLKPVSAGPLPCKICGNAAPLRGVVDFNKSCAETGGVRLPLSGIPIYYRRCAACNFLFTDAFDRWDRAHFMAHIYNDGYRTIDPDYEAARPKANANVVTDLFGNSRTQIRVLDFGGGNDVLCAMLRAGGFPAARTYDPMTPDYARLPEGRFDLVTCFETLEHLPDPVAGIELIVQRLAEPGLVLFSTLVQPDNFDQIGVTWWYVGPRNGHVSIFSRLALTHAWRRHGYTFGSFNDNLHVAFRTMPPFSAHLPIIDRSSAPSETSR